MQTNLTKGALVLLLWGGAAGWTLGLEENPNLRIDPVKVAQLKRLEPLTPEKVRVFMDSGQLDNHQAEFVVKHIDRNGILSMPEAHVGLETHPEPVARVPEGRAMASGRAGELPRRPDGSLDTLAYIYRLDQEPWDQLSETERRRLSAHLSAYRVAGAGEHEAIKQDLRAAVPGCNPLIGSAYADPIDLAEAVSLWKAVSWSGNPRAAGYIATLHQKTMQTANPVLIPYAKDIGGLILRRKEGRAEPRQRWYESRDLRNLVVDLEKSIGQCSGVRATTYLMDVYAARYRGEAPMRDSSRDQKRMVQACGGDKEGFDNGEPGTWGSSLPPVERAFIAERLIPHLRAEDGDLRDIARDGLLVALGGHDKKLKDRLKNAHKEWGAFESWYVQRREELLAGKP